MNKIIPLNVALLEYNSHAVVFIPAEFMFNM